MYVSDRQTDRQMMLSACIGYADALLKPNFDIAYSECEHSA